MARLELAAARARGGTGSATGATPARPSGCPRARGDWGTRGEWIFALVWGACLTGALFLWGPAAVFGTIFGLWLLVSLACAPAVVWIVVIVAVLCGCDFGTDE